MSKTVLFIWTLLISLYWLQTKSLQEDIFIVQKYLNSSAGIASVNLLLCWDIKMQLELLKMLCSSKSVKTSCGVFEIDEKILPSGREEVNAVVLMDLACSETWTFLHRIELDKYEKFRWIFLNAGKLDKQMSFFDLMKSKNIGPASEMFFVTSIVNGKVLKQVYKTARNESLTVETYSVWTNEYINVTQGSLTTSKRRQNLHRASIRASMVVTNNDTLNHLIDYRDAHIDTISKVNYVLTNHVMDYLNASVQYSIVPSWGYLDKESGEWSGMIGELTKDTADIGATALFYTIDRIAVIEYVGLTTRTVSRFVFQSPKLSYTDNVFVLPFSTVVWMCIISLIPVVGISLALVTWVEWRNEGNDPANPGLLHPSLKDSLQLVLGAVCQQGSSTMPRSLSARIITFLIFLVLMFLYASYSANIVALLQSPSNKIQTLEDLLHSRISLGVHDTVFNRFYFPRQTDKLKKQVFEKKIATADGKGNFLPLTNGIARMKNGLYGFYFERGSGYKIISETFDEDEKCGLIEIPFLQMSDPHYAIQKNSSYRELMKIGLFRLFEHGLQSRQNDRLYTKKPTCSVGTGGKFISVGVIDVEPALLLLCWGFGFAFTTLLLELFVWKYKLRTLVN